MANHHILQELGREFQYACGKAGCSMREENALLCLKLEAFLYFCHIHGFCEEPRKLYMLLWGQHKICTAETSSVHYVLDQLKRKLPEFRSKMQFEMALQLYLSIPKILRLYDVDSVKGLHGLTIDALEAGRISVYQAWIREEVKTNAVPLTLSPDTTAYQFLYQDKTYSVQLDRGLSVTGLAYPRIRGRKGGGFSVSIEQLILAAKEMDKQIDKKISMGAKLHQENYEQRMHISVQQLKANGKLSKAQKITVEEICNIIGMVGSGKSTLRDVMAYEAARRGYRVCLVVNSVKDVYQLADKFKLLGIKTAAVCGKSAKSITEQQKKMLDGNEYYLDAAYSIHLTAACLLDGCMKRENNLGTIDYGLEPCYELKMETQNGHRSKLLCPFYYICPRKKDERRMLDADIILTHPWGVVVN